MSFSFTRLKRLRTNADVTQSEIAKKLGIKRTTYQSYESGRAVPPSETLVKIADMLDTTVDYLYNNDTVGKAIDGSKDFSELMKYAISIVPDLDVPENIKPLILNALNQADELYKLN